MENSLCQVSQGNPDLSTRKREKDDKAYSVISPLYKKVKLNENNNISLNAVKGGKVENLGKFAYNYGFGNDPVLVTMQETDADSEDQEGMEELVVVTMDDLSQRTGVSEDSLKVCETGKNFTKDERGDDSAKKQTKQCQISRDYIQIDSALDSDRKKGNSLKTAMDDKEKYTLRLTMLDDRVNVAARGRGKRDQVLESNYTSMIPKKKCDTIVKDPVKLENHRYHTVQATRLDSRPIYRTQNNGISIAPSISTNRICNVGASNVKSIVTNARNVIHDNSLKSAVNGMPSTGNISKASVTRIIDTSARQTSATNVIRNPAVNSVQIAKTVGINGRQQNGILHTIAKSVNPIAGFANKPSVETNNSIVMKVVSKVEAKPQEESVKLGKPDQIWGQYCKDGTYTCPYCQEKSWEYLNRFCYHMIRMHGEKPFRCEECEESFNTHKLLTQHVAKHTDEMMFVCTSAGCKQSFRTAARLQKHQKTDHHEEFEFGCPAVGCTLKFSSPHEQEEHLKNEHSEAKHFHCQQNSCHYMATTLTHLHMHMDTHKQDSIQTVQCEECGESVTKPTLAAHRLKHANMQHQCPECSYATRYKRYMDNHMKRRHSKVKEPKEADKIWKCSDCSFSAMWAHELREHRIKKHELTCMLKCNQCEFSTPSEAALKTHMSSHTSERPYICLGCTKGFLQQSTNNSQELFLCPKHANTKQLKCHLCKYECVKQDVLKQHVKKVHGIKNYKLDEKNRLEQTAELSIIPGPLSSAAVSVGVSDTVLHNTIDSLHFTRNNDTTNLGIDHDSSSTLSSISVEEQNMIETIEEVVEMESNPSNEPLKFGLDELDLSVPLEYMNADFESQSSFDDLNCIDQSPALFQDVSIVDQPLSISSHEVVTSSDSLETDAVNLSPVLCSSSVVPDDPGSSGVQMDPDSEKRKFGDEDLNLIASALKEGNVVLHFV